MLSNRKIVDLALEKPLPNDDSEENLCRCNMLNLLRFRAVRDLGPDCGVDVAMDAAVIAIRSADALRDHCAVIAWLWGIYRHVSMAAIGERRRARRHTQLADGTARDISAPAGSRHDLLLAKSLPAVVDALPERSGEIIRRFYGEDQSPEEIIAEMGITHTQFRLSKSRGVAALAKYFRKPPAIGKKRPIRTRKPTLIITVNDQSNTLRGWANLLRESYECIYSRHRSGSLPVYIAEWMEREQQNAA